jgi:RNA polymerase sigma-70 factor (ECF subfamily)
LGHNTVERCYRRRNGGVNSCDGRHGVDATGGSTRDEGDRLLRRCAAGDSAAVGPLVEHYRGSIFRLACRMLGDASAAEDATASALVKVWSGAAGWRGECSADTWVYRITFRAALDVRRGRKRWWQRFFAFGPSDESDAEPADAAPGPVESAERSDEAAALAGRLRTAVDKLNETDRALVHLFYYEGSSLAEIESILGIARPTLKVRLSRARDKLRKLLDPQ